MKMIWKVVIADAVVVVKGDEEEESISKKVEEQLQRAKTTEDRDVK